MTQLLINGHIYLNRGQFAEALLIEDGMVRMAGTNEEVRAAAPADCTVLDAEGRTVIPGFNDSHLHVHNLGTSLNAIRLAEVPSLEEMIRISREFIETNHVEPGKVVVGRGWNQDYFTDVDRLPNRHDLDRISTEHPLVLTRACGHMLVCNSLALERAGVTSATPQPDGGHFDVDENGEPTGIFREPAATSYLLAIIPPDTQADMEQNILTATTYAASMGITSVQSNDVRNENYRDMLAAYNHLEEEGKLPVRAYHQTCFFDLDLYKQFLAEGHVTGEGSPFNKVGPLKLFIDGSLGARTAAMRNPYADDATTKGISTFTQEELDAFVQLADAHKMSVAVHAIGDRGIEMVLDSYAKVVKDHKNDLRHGIIHCQITDQPLLERFKEDDILAYVQPIFIHYDMHVVGQRVGAELESTSYAFGTMGKMGVHVSYGTDCPVEDLNTFNNLHCAITRKDLRGNPDGGYFPGEKVDVYTAIDNYTIGGAYCSFDEKVKGRLLPGYYADLVILDQDIFSVPEDEIKNIRPVLTMMGGRVTYQK